MGMYDSVLVASSLIDKALEGTDLKFKAFNGYVDFQTKDLDNVLTVFFLEEDGSFYWEKLNQEYIPPSEEDIKKNKFSFGEYKQISPPEKIEDTRTAYIDFYDFYNTEEERIFVTFTAHVKCGKLVEPIKVKSIERTNLKEEAIQTKKSQERWKKIRATWQWRLSCFIRDSKWRIKKFLSPLFDQIHNFEKYLADTAKKKFPDEKNINNW